MENIDKELLRRWMDGNCTPEEAVLVKNYLQHLQPDSFSRQLDEDWEHANGIMDTDRTESLLSMIQFQTKARRAILRTMAVAASVIVLVVAGTLLWVNTQHKPVIMAFKTITNNRHGKMRIALPDSTAVWLSAGAALQYVSDFGQAERQVQLTGEAYFEVTKDSLHPFTVQAGNIKTTVLGTHFNVEAYHKEDLTRVSLIEGKVSVSYTDAAQRIVTTVLTPGQMLLYNRQTAAGEVLPVGVEHADAFTSPALVLHDISLHDALQRIGQHYGKTILLKEFLNDQQQFSGIVPGNDLQAALNNLAFVYQLHFKLAQDTISVERK